MTPLRLCSAALISSALLLSGCGSNNGSGTPPTPYAINGTLFGMKAGTSLTLANTVNGDTLDVSSNGSFQLEAIVFHNDAYNVTVATHPFNQTCTVSNGSGRVDEDNVTGINVHCVAAQFNVGGTVSGLAGTLLLQNNDGNDLSLTASGTFTFAAPVTAGATYRVAVQNQPANQTCTVSNGSGTASGTHVSNVAVVCINNTTPRNIGGTVTGLNGTLVVQNNFGNNTTLTADGAFAFSAPLNSGSTYSVSVLTQPFGQECTVNGAAGTANTDVGSIDIQCTSASYAVGGSIVGLGGIAGVTSVLTLRNNGELMNRRLNGHFSFPTRIAHNGAYNVTIEHQPFGQLCAITNGSGTVNGTAITNIGVTCEPRQYNLGFTVSGLVGEMDLINNGVRFRVNANLGWVFPAPVLHGASYNMGIVQMPPSQSCIVVNGSGIATADITGVEVRCSFEVLITSSQPRVLHFDWTGVGSDTLYRLFKDPDGAGPAPEVQVGLDIAAPVTEATDTVPVHILDWVNARYRVEACANTVCRSSVPLSAISAAADAIGYIKASTPGLDDRFGASVALSADGNTMVIGAPGESSNAQTIGGDQNNDLALRAGAAYVFVRSGTGWVFQAYLKASNADPQDNFGSAVAISADGDYIAVGAPGESSNSPTDKTNNDALSSGAVYVFNRLAGTWSEQAYIKASSPMQYNFFGGNLYQSLFGISMAASPLAFSADASTLVIGVGGHAVPTPDPGDVDPTNEGAAYVFTRAGSTWTQETILKASNADSSDIFGNSVAISADGTLIAVGAPLEDGAGRVINADSANDSATNAGAAYLFLRSGFGWSETYVKASNTLQNQSFGHMVALAADGNTLVVSAINESSNAVDAPEDESMVSSGALYVYERSGGLWSERQRIKPDLIVQGQQFGMSLAIAGDGSRIAAALPGDDSAGRAVGANPADTGATNSGAVLTFTRGSSGWEQSAYLKAPNTGAGDALGSALSLSADGSIMAVGALNEDGIASGVNGADSREENGLEQSGAVYLY